MTLQQIPTINSCHHSVDIPIIEGLYKEAGNISLTQVKQLCLPVLGPDQSVVTKI